MPRAMDISLTEGLFIEQGSAELLRPDYLQDTSKDWQPGIWAGHWLRIRGGSNDDAIIEILDNDENRLYFEHELANDPKASSDISGATYYIYEHMHRDDFEKNVADLLHDLIEVGKEQLMVLKQIRQGLSIQTGEDLANVDVGE